MTTHWSNEVSCVRCGTTGHVFWSEGGARDMHERVREIWGPFYGLHDSLIDGGTAIRLICPGCNREVKLGALGPSDPAELRRLWGCR